MTPSPSHRRPAAHNQRDTGRGIDSGWVRRESDMPHTDQIVALVHSDARLRSIG